MKTRLWILLATMSLAACQTTPPTPSPSPSPSATPEPTPTPMASPDTSTISVSRAGFSPLADSPANTLTFDVRMAHPDTITKWAVDIVGANGVVRTVTGDKTIPSWTWDGTTDGPKLADGKYTAKLTLTRGDVTETAESAPFDVDVTRPSGTVTVTPQPFTPGAEDVSQVTFSLNLKAGGAPLSTWRILILHPDGRQFTDFIGEDHGDNRVVWDGRDKSNNVLQGGTTYNVVVKVIDTYGNTGTLNASLPVTPGTVVAPVTVSLNGALLGQLQVYFPAYSADMDKVDAAKAKSNGTALDKLAAMLKASPGSKIRVIGHANQVLWEDPVKAKFEQTETLIPLSKARAEAVLAALKSRGLDSSLFTVTGVGADGNVVPFSDLPNTWKNRRVEFNVEQ